MAFTLPELGYAYDALEPHIDARTMEIHHTKHHNGYTNKLNAAIEGTDLADKSIDDILKNLDTSNTGVRNNGGGYWNHKLFWEILNPEDRGRLSGELLDAVNEAFGSKDAMVEQFSKAAATRFGSGWAWLCVHPGGKVEICSSANQDNPMMPGIGCGGTPIMGLDVWEHAYYLDFQNNRGAYIETFLNNLISWQFAARNFAAEWAEA